jgi:PKD repeat protein
MRRFSYTLFKDAKVLGKKPIGFLVVALMLIGNVGYGQISDPSPYCNPNHDCTFEDITFFSLANVTNQSACDDNGDVNYYNNTTIEVNKGQDYTLSLNATNDDSYMAVWVDFDNSGTFDSDEILINTNSQVDDRLSTTVNFDGRPCGDTRLRVMSSQFNPIDPGDACNHPGSFGDGSVEDYNISIGTPSNPSQDLAISNVEVTSNQRNPSFGDLNFTVFTGNNQVIPAGDTIPVTYKTTLQPNPKLVEYVVQKKIKKCGAREITLDKVISNECPGINEVQVVNQWAPDMNATNDTGRAELGLSYSEGFEAGQVPSGWSTSNAGRAEVFDGCGGAHTGTYFLNLDQASGFEDQVWAQRQFDISNTGKLELSFWFKDYDGISNGIDAFNDKGVFVSVDGGNNFERIFSLNNIQAGNWTKITINNLKQAIRDAGLTIPADGKIIIRFSQKDSLDRCGEGFGFDDIRLKPVSPSQPQSPPQATIIPRKAFVNAPEVFTISGSASERAWSVNGNPVSNSGSELRYTFTDTGTQTIGVKSAGCFFDVVREKINVVEPTQKPDANFFTEKNVLCANESIKIDNETLRGATDFQWQISPQTVNGRKAIQYQNSDSAFIPEVKFMEEGKYNITLIASNKIGTDTFSQEQYIRVQKCYTTCNDMMSTKSEGLLFDSAGRDPFIDSAGPSSCAFTINPSCTDSLVANLQQLNIGGNFANGIRDNLKIYDGTSTSAPAIHDRLGYAGGFYEGNAPSGSQPIVARSGAMTVVLNTNGEDNSEDFSLEWDAKQSAGSGLRQMISSVGLNAPDTAYTSGFTNFLINNPVSDAQYEINLPGFNRSISQDTIIPAKVSGVDPGSYQVELITEKCGYADTVTEMVYFKDVTNKPNAEFTASKTKLTEGDTVKLFDLSKPGIETHRWSFMPSDAITYVNGTDSSSTNPSIVIDQAGQYRVDLIVSNKIGRSVEAKIDYLVVEEPVVATGCTPVVGQEVRDLTINAFKVYRSNGDLIYENSSGFSSNGYGQYDAASELSLASGREYIFEIERNTAFNDLAYGAWLDLNQDGDLTANEALFKNSRDSGFTVRDTVTIPKGPAGNTTLRIATNLAGGALKGCGPHQAGEFEDYGVNFKGDIDPPTISLKGGDTVTVDVCNPATADTGATAFDLVDGNLSGQVELRNAELLTNPGVYNLPYVVTDSAGNRASKSQTIIVTPDNVDPQVSLNGAARVTVNLNDSFMDPGANASDACGAVDTIIREGAVNSSVIGTKKLRYIAFDGADNTDTATRLVTVEDPEAPTAQLLGSDTVVLSVFGNYDEPGLVSDDNYRDSTIVRINGSVNTDSVGVYELTYEVADLDTNITTLTRTVIVEDTKAPQFSDIPDNAVVLPVNQPIDIPFDVSDNYYEESDLQVQRTGGYFETYPDGVADSLGTYTARFEVTDGSGNTNSFSIAVQVVDQTAPTVTLDRPVVNINRFAQFKDSLGDTYQVTDNYYDVAKITVNRYGTYFKEYMQGGQSSGVYEIRYKATDASGNESQEVIRTVNVRDKTTGIGDESGEMAVAVYPNPTDGLVNLELGNLPENQVAVSVINAKGQTVRSIDRQIGGQNRNYQLDLSNEAKGLYKVKVRAGDEVVTESVVVQ